MSKTVNFREKKWPEENEHTVTYRTPEEIQSFLDDLESDTELSDTVRMTPRMFLCNVL